MAPVLVLFAMANTDLESLVADWTSAFPELELTRIGTLVSISEGRTPTFASAGWDHFKTEPKV